jgi:hypothetical protein
MKTDLCVPEPRNSAHTVTMSTSDQALLRRVKALTKRVKELETKPAATVKTTTVVEVVVPSSRPKSKQGACYRCGRTSHFVADCYATYDTNGDEIDD